MMDCARDIDLLGVSVPQVRISARSLDLLGFFQQSCAGVSLILYHFIGSGVYSLSIFILPTRRAI